MKIRRMRLLELVLVLASMAVAGSSQAALINYTVDGIGPTQFPSSITVPNDAPWGPNGYPGDTVELLSYTGSLNLAAGTSILKINTVLWTIDYTYGGTPEPWPDITFAVPAGRSMTLDSLANNLNQNGTLLVNYYNDTLSFTQGSIVSFITQGYQINVTPLGLAPADGSNFDGSNPWVQPTRDLMARFDVTTVPEPSSLLLFATGLPLLHSAIRRKRRAA